MGDLIKLLPDNIANQIAAGEVIQRPASVVKELMENAIDAGGTRIQLIIREGGKQLIQVVDNGCGMSVTDARMSFERHATSKIRQADDLFQIRTMGFRGEALASIASVAMVELKTRRAEDEVGTRILIEASRIQIQEDCSTPPGTSISVKNLFFNVPARRKFLKADHVESKHILEEFQRIALSRSDIFFSLHHNDQEVFHLPAGNDRQRVVGILGPSVNARLVPVAEDTGDLTISGFVGKPEAAKKTRGEQYLFVNGRFIKSGYLHHGIVSAYEELIGQDQHPMYVLYLETDPARIDVNVHPTKHEIKFDDERLVYHFVKVAVRHALGRHGMIPTLDFEADHSIAPSKMNFTPGIGTSFSSGTQKAGKQDWEALFSGLEKPIRSENPQHVLAFPDTLAPAFRAESDIIAGSGQENEDPESNEVQAIQLQMRYILSPIKSGLIIIDQQAAHERILYEQYINRLAGNPQMIQKELFPRTITVTPANAVVLHSLLEALHHLGFELEPFGKETFILHGVPADMAPDLDAVQLILNMLQQSGDDLPLAAGNREQLAKRLAAQTATPPGKALTTVEMRSLIDRLFACEMPYKSPRGNTCFITIDQPEIEKRFR